MTRARIPIPREPVEAFCKRHHIRRLSLFGSVLRDDFDASSDVDILVEFEPGRIPGVLKMAGLELELGEILGRKVDLRTPRELSRHFRQDVLKTCEEQYVSL